MPASSPPTASARSTPGRIRALDVLRGIAITGTLGTNIWIFTDPAGPAAFINGAETGSLAANVEAVLRFLANGKFLALLTLMFGIGLELQYRSARRRGARWPGWYPWRAGLLFLEGLLHYVLIFEFDVLMSYAATSMLVAYLIGRSDRAQRGWIIAQASIHVLAMGLLTTVLLAGRGSVQSVAETTLFSEGSYADQVVARLDNALAYRAEAIFIIPMSIALFLLGARLLRAGLFDDGERGKRLRARLMLFGLGFGVPANLVTTFAGPDWFFVDRYVLAPVVALGLLALIPAVLHGMSRTHGFLREGFTAVGRTALSCYVFQNLVASILCYGWGFGLAAAFEPYRPWWVVGLWAAICALFMVLATLWLQRFERGPVEMVWHWAYRAPQRERTAASPS